MGMKATSGNPVPGTGLMIDAVDILRRRYLRDAPERVAAVAAFDRTQNMVIRYWTEQAARHSRISDLHSNPRLLHYHHFLATVAALRAHRS